MKAFDIANVLIYRRMPESDLTAEQKAELAKADAFDAMKLALGPLSNENAREALTNKLLLALLEGTIPVATDVAALRGAFDVVANSSAVADVMAVDVVAAPVVVAEPAVVAAADDVVAPDPIPVVEVDPAIAAAAADPASVVPAPVVEEAVVAEPVGAPI